MFGRYLVRKNGITLADWKNKLVRSYVILWDALSRHQAGAEPTVNVGTVNVVAQGSQAIVGNVTQNQTPPHAATRMLSSTGSILTKQLRNAGGFRT
jgi:hypothetical protein